MCLEEVGIGVRTLCLAENECDEMFVCREDDSAFEASSALCRRDVVSARQDRHAVCSEMEVSRRYAEMFCPSRCKCRRYVGMSVAMQQDDQWRWELWWETRGNSDVVGFTCMWSGGSGPAQYVGRSFQTRLAASHQTRLVCELWRQHEGRRSQDGKNLTLCLRIRIGLFNLPTWLL